MKKLLAVILILSLLLPVSAFADADVPAWLMEGSWNHFQSTADGMLLTSLYLDDDGTAYFVTQLFNAEGPGLGRAFRGTWEKTGVDTLHVVTGNNSSLDLTYCTYNMMFDYAMQDYYFRAELGDDDKIK